MVLHSTAKDSNFRGSIRKYLVDTIETAAAKAVFFHHVTEVPEDALGAKLEEWVVVSFGDRELGTIAEQYILLTLFTRKDFEGDNLSALVDFVYDLLEDNIDLLDFADSMAVIGGLVPVKITDSAEMDGKDETKLKTIRIDFKWGSV